MKVEGIEDVRKLLVRLKRQAGEANISAVAGYSQRYAMPVHEDLDARHAEGKFAKYLETPARRYSGVLADIIKQVYAKTGSMRTALMIAVLRLLRESQIIVPVDTSALKASGFVALDNDIEREAQAAFVRSEAIRMASLAGRNKNR